MTSAAAPSLTVSAYFARMHALVDAIPLDEVVGLAQLIIKVAENDGAIYVFGNGGSAATANHVCCDLTKNTRVPGAPRIRCLSLAGALPLISAFSNDESYDESFAGPLRALGRAGDLALAVSASGNSPNVLHALEAARDLGMYTAALLGFAGGGALSLADVPIVVPCDSVPHIEDAHLMINHALTECLRDLLRR